jgi:hypothetical protein
MPEEAREAMHTVDGLVRVRHAASVRKSANHGHGQHLLHAVGGRYAPLLGLRLEEVQRDSLERPRGALSADLVE